MRPAGGVQCTVPLGSSASPYSWRRSSEQTQLPSGETPEGRIPKGAATGEAAASIGPCIDFREHRSSRALATSYTAERSRGGVFSLRLNAKPAATPEGRTERLRRARAAALAVRAAFPGIQQLRLEFSFEGASSHAPAAQSHLLYPAARAFFEFPCPHADCDGQFDLTAVVQHAIADATHASRGDVVCSGSRALDHRSKQPCRLHLLYSVTAVL